MIIREISLEQNLDYREEIQKVLQGVKVVSKYNNVTYEVKDICFDLNTESTFELCHEGQKYEVSYFDYFTKRYTETITQKKQPLLQKKTPFKRLVPSNLKQLSLSWEK